MKRSARDGAIFSVPVCSSPSIDVTAVDDTSGPEYVQLAEKALFVVILSGVAIMACSFAAQLF